MKQFKDIAKNSSIVCAFIGTNFPTTEHTTIIESVKTTASSLDAPSIIFVNHNETLDVAMWMEKMYEGISFVETDIDSTTGMVEELDLLYHNVVVVDSFQKAALFEDHKFVGVDTSYVLNESATDKAIKNKNFKEFADLYVGYLSESDTRKLYSITNPPTKFKDIKRSIDNTRESFYQGESFVVGSIVEDANQTPYEVMDRGSNYLVVVDAHGTTSRKFPSSLVESTNTIDFGDSYFKGYTPSQRFFDNEEIVESFAATIADYENGEVSDTFAILKTIKLVDNFVLGESVDLGQIQFSINKIEQSHNHQYLLEMADKSIATQLQAARIIAGAVGASTSGNNPSEIVNGAIRKAKGTTNPTQMKILANMLQTASKVGLSYDTKLMESVDDRMVAIHKHQKLLKEKPTPEVLAAHRDMRKLGVDYDARDVGGKRAMVRDILDHNHGPNTVSSYKALKAQIRRSMDETTSYGSGRSMEHDFANQVATKVTSYKLVDKKTKRVVSTHRSAPEAVQARNKIRGTMDSHSIVKEDLNEVHLDPDYKEEIDILGYAALKKKLAQATGIKNYGEQEPGKEIDLVDKDGIVVKDQHTKPGFSLNATNDTNRKMKVRQLKDG